jgi:hypothetical protein
MRRLTRCSLCRERKARWLIVLAGTVWGIFFFGYTPEMVFADGIYGRLNLTYSHAETTSTDSTGTSSDDSNRAFFQQYTLTADKYLYPNLKLFASGMFQKTEATSSTNGEGSWGDTTVMRPYIDLTLRTPVFSAGVNYNAVTTEQKSMNAPNTTYNYQAYGGILGWKPEGLPTLDLTLTRSYSYDENRIYQDIVSDTAYLYSRYEPSQTVRLRYQGSYLDTKDILKDVDTTTVGNDIRIMYDDQYWRQLVTVSTYYDYGHNSTDVTTSGMGTVSFQVFAVDGLFLNSDNLLTAPLSSSPFLIDNTMTGPTSATNNIGSATFTASPPDLTARNIGLQFAVATQMNTLDVWVYSVTGATIDTAVPAYLPTPVAGSFTWAVYTSDDNLNWRLYQTGIPAPYVLDASRPGVGRFEITFPNVTTKYIKVVVSPLSPVAAGGQGRDFPGVYVTELQAFITTAAANVTGTTTATNQTGALAANVALLRQNPSLTYNFSYFFSNQESQFSTTRSSTMSNGLTAQHQFNPIFAGTAQVQRVDDSSPSGDRVTLRFGAQLTAIPLRTLSHSLGLSSATEQSPTGRSKSNALTLSNTAELYRNITAFLNGGLSDTYSENDQKIASTYYNGGINLIPIETLNITLSSGGNKSDQSGGGVPDSTLSTRTNELDVSYYPVRTLYLAAAWRVSKASGQATDRLTNYQLNWSPFPGGDLVLNFSYYETQRALDNSINKTYIPSLRWNINRKTFATLAYNSTESSSIFGQSTTRIYSTSLNMNF